MKRVTSVDVAKAVGVSQSTVSRALADDSRISKGTKRKIHKAAADLGYTPNEIARSLQTNKTNMVGLIMADILNPFYPAVLDLMTQQLHQMGKRLMLISVPAGFEVDDVLPSMLQYQVDGVIITSAILSSQMRDLLQNRRTRVVLFNRSLEDFSVNSVCCENRAASIEVARRLIGAGHRKLAIIGGRPDTSTHRERYAGFEEELHLHGLELVGNEIGGNTYDGAYEAALRLMKARDKPDAIFCIADVMALGALDAVRSKLGMKVPDDISIVGFDDIPPASWPAYDLATVRQPIRAMVSRTLSLLFDPDNLPPMAVQVPGKLMVRGSARLSAPEAT